MNRSGYRPHISSIASLPLSALLLVFFFLPWMRLSCDPRAAARMASQRPAGLPLEMLSSMEIGHASGWQLANGSMTFNQTPANAQGMAPTDGEKSPNARPWLYLCLALPILMLMTGALALTGSLSRHGAGKALLLLGIAGLGLSLAALSIDYIDDITDQAVDQVEGDAGGLSPTGRMAFQRQLDVMGGQLKKFIKTKATPFLWATLGLYAAIAACGLAGLNAPEELSEPVHEQPAPAWRATPAREPEPRPQPQPQESPFAGGPEIFQPWKAGASQPVSTGTEPPSNGPTADP
jgi:hypothetical protein